MLEHQVRMRAAKAQQTCRPGCLPWQQERKPAKTCIGSAGADQMQEGRLGCFGCCIRQGCWKRVPDIRHDLWRCILGAERLLPPADLCNQQSRYGLGLGNQRVVPSLASEPVCFGAQICDECRVARRTGLRPYASPNPCLLWRAPDL